MPALEELVGSPRLGFCRCDGGGRRRVLNRPVEKVGFVGLVGLVLPLLVAGGASVTASPLVPIVCAGIVGLFAGGNRDRDAGASDLGLAMPLNVDEIGDDRGRPVCEDGAFVGRRDIRGRRAGAVVRFVGSSIDPREGKINWLDWAQRVI